MIMERVGNQKLFNNFKRKEIYMKSLAFIVFLFFIIKIMPQNVLNVPSEYPAIQTALNEAQEGDTILSSTWYLL